MGLYVFRKISVKTRTLMLSVGIHYCMHDQICDVNACAWAAKLRFGSTISGNAASAPSCISLP